MSAEVLRRAAALMRKRAERASFEQSPAPMEGWYAHLADDGRAWVSGADGKWLSVHGYPNGAEHIASWHPVVALKIADWLDSVADAHEPPDGSPGNRGRTITIVDDAHAEVIARAYLGESS